MIKNGFHQIKQTKDASKTLYSSQFDADYHSIHGALKESLHVYIKYGLQSFDSASLSILDVGFGTGLNALLTYRKKSSDQHISYVTLEPFPLPMKLVESLNYHETPHELSVLNDFHASQDSVPLIVSRTFRFTKYEKKVEDFESKTGFDLIYYDAFGPRSQPELWTVSIFENLFRMMHPGGRFVTFCAQGQMKRNLRQVGFSVESVAGPPGKREMTIATKY